MIILKSAVPLALLISLAKWKGINRKQSTRWQHLSRLKARAFFSLKIFFSCFETQQPILGTGTAIWWATEPYCSPYFETIRLARESLLNGKDKKHGKPLCYVRECCGTRLNEEFGAHLFD
jgi:hypothetical protein